MSQHRNFWTSLNAIGNYIIAVPSTLNFTYSSGLTNTFNIDSNISYSITITSGSSWMSVDKNNYTGNTIVTVETLSENTDLDIRTGTIVISDDTLSIIKTVTVRQSILDISSPNELFAIPYNSNYVELIWDINYTIEDGISIERSSDNVTFTEINTTTGTSYKYYDNTVLDNTQYYYRVRSYKGNRYSEYSNVVSAKPGIRSVWDGTSISTTFDGGTGTQTNPYLISSGSTLAYLSSYINTGGTNSGLYWKVTTDIDLNSHNWTPIGNSTYKWLGSIDFNGHKIYNLYINRNNTYNGVFGYVYTNGTILNGGIESGSVIGNNYTGGWIGDCYGGVIINCYNKSNISAYTGTPQFHGGISGRLTSTVTCTNCYNSGNLTNTGYDVGGITGMQVAGNITNCYSSGSVDTTTGKQHGGLIGNKTGGNIYHCFYDNTVCSVGAINYADVSGSADGLSTTLMKTESTFSTYWDMTVWELNSSYPTLTVFDDSPSYYIANGLLTQSGNTLNTYAGAMIHSGVGYKKLVRGINPRRELSGRKFLVAEHADFYNEDLMFVIPILVKYGFSASEYTPTKFADDNPLNMQPENTTDTNPLDYRRIITSGSFISHHYFQHWTWGILFPLMDGTNYCTNDDLRVARADGTNAFGYDVNTSLLTSYGDVMCDSDHLDIVSYENTLFKDLSDAQCLDLRHKVSYFYADDYRFKQRMLKILDYLSNLYCGTTGYSVVDGDYTANTINTVDHNYPTTSTRVLGGVFQGSSTLCNHEIWERIETIFQEWTKSLGRDYKIRLSVTPGGWSNHFMYIPSNPTSTHIKYHDRECTKHANCFSSYYSSILDKTRCFADIAEDEGFIVAPGGYTGYAWTNYDGNQRKEKGVMYKLNAPISQSNCIGDGYYDCQRPLDYTLGDDITGFTSLLAESNVMKAKYELTAQDETSTAVSSGDIFAQFINEMDKRIAWGLLVETNEDYGVGLVNTTERRAHAALVLELYCQYCKLNGIEIISSEEAVEIMQRSISNGENIFPNAEFKTTALDTINSSYCPIYPDGWSDGEMILDGSIRTYNTNVKSYIRTYLIQNGNATMSIDTMGSGNIKIYFIRNKHPRWVGLTDFNSVCEYELTSTITVNSVNYVNQTVTFEIPNEDLITYTTENDDYQKYMKGLDNKICGLHIEMEPNTNESITIKEPSLIVT